MVGLMGCSGQSQSAAESSADVQLDIFAAVVRGAMERADWTVVIDPRPIAIYLGPTLPDSTDYLSADAPLIDARAAILRDLRASLGTAFPLREGCPGVLAEPPSRDTSGCPAEREEVLVFAAKAKAEQDEWVLSMISIIYDPMVRQGGTYDAIVTRKDGGWKLDRVVLRIALD